jgi:hypothetical protein
MDCVTSEHRRNPAQSERDAVKIRIYKGRDRIYIGSVEAFPGMKIKQGVIKRVTKAHVWVESTTPGYEKTGVPISQPSMTLTMAMKAGLFA